MISDLRQLLVGKTLLAIEVSDCDSFLRLTVRDGTTLGKIVLATTGECCSETWFADITGVKLALGKTVRDVVERNVAPVEDSRCRQEYDSFYGFTIVTDGGYLDIVYRNSSNGCYGGDCRIATDQRFWPPKNAWMRIEDDWKAN